MSATLDRMSVSFAQCGKNLNEVVMVATLVTRNACKSGFSHHDVFTLNLLFYKFCTFSVICKDDAAVNCITLQHKKGSFLSTLTGCTILVVI
jgi:hypothetical protein